MSNHSILVSPSDGLLSIYNDREEKVKALDNVPLFKLFDMQKEYFLMFESIAVAASAINQIRVHCVLLQKISSHSIYTRYFQRKYKLPWQRILTLKLKDDEWKEPVF